MDTMAHEGKALKAHAPPTQIGMVGLRAATSDIVHRVSYTGERFLITNAGKPVAAIVSIEDLRKVEAVDEGKLQPVPPPVRVVA